MTELFLDIIWSIPFILVIIFVFNTVFYTPTLLSNTINKFFSQYKQEPDTNGRLKSVSGILKFSARWTVAYLFVLYSIITLVTYQFDVETFTVLLSITLATANSVITYNYLRNQFSTTNIPFPNLQIAIIEIVKMVLLVVVNYIAIFTIGIFVSGYYLG